MAETSDECFGAAAGAVGEDNEIGGDKAMSTSADLHFVRHLTDLQTLSSVQNSNKVNRQKII